MGPAYKWLIGMILILLPYVANITMPCRFKNILFLCVISIIVNISDSGLLDSSHRCGISDAECQRNFFQYMGNNYFKKGIPKLGIPVLDPIELQNLTISFGDVLTVTIVDGQAEGIGDCNITRYETDIETGLKISESICDSLIIKGHYVLETGPTLKLLVGETFNSEGYIEATFEQWYINSSYPFEVERHEDGDIYIHCLFEEAQYEQNFGNIHIEVANLTTGDELTSKSAVDFINANWRPLIKSFGRYFGDASLKFYYMVHDNFFNNVPAKYYITDDLSPYVESEDE